MGGVFRFDFNVVFFSLKLIAMGKTCKTPLLAGASLETPLRVGLVDKGATATRRKESLSSPSPQPRFKAAAMLSRTCLRIKGAFNSAGDVWSELSRRDVSGSSGERVGCR